MRQSWPQKSRHLASRKSGTLSSEKLILLSRSARGGRALAFSKEVFRRLGNLWIFFKAREKSSNLRSTRGKSQGKKGNGGRGRGRRGGEEKRELRELRKTERRNSRRPGKMRIVCTHEGNYPSSLPRATPCPIPIFSVSRGRRRWRTREGGRAEERGGRGRGKKEREKERRGTKFRIFADVSPWKDRGVGCSLTFSNERIFQRNPV